MGFSWLSSLLKPTFLFGTFILAGLTGIYFLATITISRTAVLTISVAVVFLYALMGWLIHYKRGSSTREYSDFADSVYYLGFLYTLFSLIFSTVLGFSISNDIDSIVKAFGVGLSTTATGLALRIFIQFFIEHEAEDDQSTNTLNSMDMLAEKLNLLGSTLENSIQSLKMQIESIKINPDIINSALEIEAEKLTEQVGKLTAKYVESNTKTSDILEQHALAFSEHEKDTLKIAKNLSESTNAVLLKHQQQLESIHFDPEALSKALSQGSTELESALQTINTEYDQIATSIKGTANNHNQLQDKIINDLHTTIKNIITQFDALPEAADQIVREANMFERALNDTATSANIASNEIDDLSERAANGSLQFTKMGETIGKFSEKAPDMTASLNRQLQQIDRVEKIARDRVDQLHKLQTELNQIHLDAAATLSSINTALKKSAESVVELSKNEFSKPSTRGLKMMLKRIFRRNE